MRLGVSGCFDGGRYLPGDVDVAGDRIRAVGLEPAGTGGVAAPGFVDLQVNGFAGVDLLAADADGYREAGRALLATGVTAYQPTLITSAEATLVAALGTVGAVRERAGPGPRILGAHVEGPFLAPNRTGTHPVEHRRDPDPALLGRLLDAGPVGYWTLAPELPGADTLVDRLLERGVVVSAGHSDATAAQANAAFDRGIRTVTHLFNAMRRFQPRDPGLPGAALARADVVVQIVVDGHHLADDTVRLVWRAAAGRTALVTDATAAAGRGDGSFRLGDVEVEVRDGAVRRADGTLAGSALTLDAAVRNLVALGIEPAAAVDAVTGVPARVLGRDDLGALRPGATADVVVLDDDLTVRRVLRAGADVHGR